MHNGLYQTIARAAAALSFLALCYAAGRALPGAPGSAAGQAAVLGSPSQRAPYDLQVVSISRGRMRRHGKHVGLPPAESGWGYAPQWSWVSRRALYLAGHSEDTRIVVASPAKGTNTPIPWSSGAFYARWSPDGRALFAIRNFRNTPTDFRRLTYIDLRHGRVAELLDSVATADFTPDGHAIVFSRLFVGEKPAGNLDFLTIGPPAGLRRVWYVSSPPGAEAREVEGGEVDRLLGAAFRHAIATWPRLPLWGTYWVSTINLGISPHGRYVFVPEAQSIPKNGKPLVLNLPAEYGIMDGSGRLTRFEPGEYGFRLVGWSPDEKYLYGMGGFGESELITVTAATGKVRHEKLRPPEGWHMYVVAFRPARR